MNAILQTISWNQSSPLKRVGGRASFPKDRSALSLGERVKMRHENHGDSLEIAHLVNAIWAGKIGGHQKPYRGDNVKRVRWED